MFEAIRPFPGITHIRDAMEVCFTLIEGTKQAVLFDTGYGTEDVRTYISTLTDKPVSVYLSHGHHDHVLGARWFGKSFLCWEDLEEFLLRTGREQRSRVKQQAEEQHVPVPADFLEAPIAIPEPILFPERTGRFDSLILDPGGLKIRIMKVPGHTPGSIVIHVPAYGLLLTGDDWNPCTWMWFPCSLSAREWRENMKELIRTLENVEGGHISHVICSHQPAVRKGYELKAFLDYMTDERMMNAEKADMGTPIHTCQIRNEKEDWTLLFDRDRI